jgi:hypothetical protein
MQTLMGQTDLIATAMSQLGAAKASKGLAYTAFISGLKDRGDRPRSFKLNSKKQDPKLNQRWSKTQVSAGVWFWRRSASVEWERKVVNIVNAGVEMDVSFGQVLTLPGGPYGLSTPMDPNLTGCTPWYNSEALNAARTQNDNRLWKHGAPTWEQTFGPKGNLQAATTALVVVDGIESTLTTTHEITKSDHETFKQEANGGFWPFYGNSSSGFTNNADFNDRGNFTITSKAKLGNPKVLGVVVTSIEKAFR